MHSRHRDPESMSVIPTRAAIAVCGGASLLACGALLAGVDSSLVIATAAVLVAGMVVVAATDFWRTRLALSAHPLAVERRFPRALALAVRQTLEITLVNPGPQAWRVLLFDGVDGTLAFEGLPRALELPPERRLQVTYPVVPRMRGPVRFGAAQVRVRSLWRLFEIQQAVGAGCELKVFPNFAAVARYAWLAGDRRLQQIGIKTYIQRGPGTDFKQLREYLPDDPVRHIDWKATLRHSRPVVREFEDSRDQCVIFLLDCGRRMRADEGPLSAHGSHFDQCLNAMMLLSYVALKEGDEVGALAFGTAPDDVREFAPRKGSITLDALMGRFYDVQPTTAYSDYQQVARKLMARHRKRALVVMLTNFRDEDVAELSPALRLMRTRHLVLLASLRERVQDDLAASPLRNNEQVLTVAAAHLFEQSRRDAFAKVVGNDPLAIDVDPAHLASSLVNRYHAVKRARLL